MATLIDQLTELHYFVDKMQDTSSSLDKVKLLKELSDREKYPHGGFIMNVIEYTYNPYKQYNVTSKTIKKNPDLHKIGYFDLFVLLDALNKRTITGHDAIAHINAFTDPLAKDNLPSYVELIYRIIDKDLEIRAGAKVLNKAIPGLIPEFNVALAKNYEPKLASFGENEVDTWYASRKLDGVRCLAVVDEEGKCTLYSRMGKEFTTLDKIKKAIESTGIVNYVFDGEICLLDKDGNEDFQGVMKELRKKDHQIENPTFMIFDMIHKIDFDNGKSEDGTILSDRLHTLRTWLVGINNFSTDKDNKVREETLRYLDQYAITDDRHFGMWEQMAAEKDWEGFMLRKDTMYEGKRSKNLLKVKTFHDAEYEVVGYDVGPMAVVRDGKEKQETMLSQVYIEHKGHRVKVGSGFTQEQRIKYTTEEIIGKTITVQYFEETKNDKGGISLRFPTVKYIYETVRDA